MRVSKRVAIATPDPVVLILQSEATVSGEVVKIGDKTYRVMLADDMAIVHVLCHC